MENNEPLYTDEEMNFIKNATPEQREAFKIGMNIGMKLENLWYRAAVHSDPTVFPKMCDIWGIEVPEAAQERVKQHERKQKAKWWQFWIWMA